MRRGGVAHVGGGRRSRMWVTLGGSTVLSAGVRGGVRHTDPVTLSGSALEGPTPTFASDRIQRATCFRVPKRNQEVTSEPTCDGKNPGSKTLLRYGGTEKSPPSSVNLTRYNSYAEGIKKNSAKPQNNRGQEKKVV